MSPCYDLLNTIIEYRRPDEEIALPLKGKMKKLTRKLFVQYFGRERCELTQKVIDEVLEAFPVAMPKWEDYITRSFLSPEMQEKYRDLVESRLKRLELV